MWLEVGIALCFLFFATVWFYKQRRDRFEILQLEFGAILDSGKELAQEKQPIVVRGTPIPPILTQANLARMTRIHGFPLHMDYPTTVLQYVQAPGSAGADLQAAGLPLMSSEAARALAEELSLPTWATHTFQDAFREFTGLPPFLGSITTKLLFGGHGMVRTTSVYTCIVPTEGTYTLSLVSRASEEFLPKRWQSRYPSSLSMEDTPLVADIQFLDVILRPGTMACIPAHTIVSLQPDSLATFHSAIRLELDTPISSLAKLLEEL